MLLDIHLCHHFDILYAHIRKKALIPYAPALTLVSFNLETMAKAFNTTVLGLEKELQELITDNPTHVALFSRKYWLPSVQKLKKIIVLSSHIDD